MGVAKRAIQVHTTDLVPDELKNAIHQAIAGGKRVVLAVAQRKGGSGKTTCTRTPAEFAAIPESLGLKTLAVDIDSQCSLSKLYLSMETPVEGFARPPVHPDFDAAAEGQEWDGRSSSADIFFSGGTSPYPVTRLTGVGQLEILPGDAAKLNEIEEQDRTVLAERVQNRLRDWVNVNEVKHEYPFIVIDTAPSDHPLTRAALRAATHLLVPVTMEQQGTDGLYEMLSMWRRENARRTEEDYLDIIGIQPNLMSRGSLHDEMYAALKVNRAFSQYLSPVVLKRRQAVAERDVRGMKPNSIFHLPPSDESRQMMVKFARYVMGKAFVPEWDNGG